MRTLYIERVGGGCGRATQVHAFTKSQRGKHTKDYIKTGNGEKRDFANEDPVEMIQEATRNGFAVVAA